MIPQQYPTSSESLPSVCYVDSFTLSQLLSMHSYHTPNTSLILAKLFNSILPIKFCTSSSKLPSSSAPCIIHGLHSSCFLYTWLNHLNSIPSLSSMYVFISTSTSYPSISFLGHFISNTFNLCIFVLSNLQFSDPHVEMSVQLLAVELFSPL